jgi:hypothetical protein
MAEGGKVAAWLTANGDKARLVATACQSSALTH